jgi:hypothetical protein
MTGAADIVAAAADTGAVGAEDIVGVDEITVPGRGGRLFVAGMGVGAAL